MAGRGDMGLRNITFFAETVTDEESVLGHNEFGFKRAEEEDNEAPVVFHCGRCKLPVGDSLSWVGSEDDQNQILLKRVTDSVVVGSEPFLSRTQTELGCLIVDLSCGGCSSPMGRVYVSTPRNLDYKRNLFCLNVENVDCYVLGSSTQKNIEDREHEPITLHYQKNADVQIGKIKALAVSMAHRILDVEAKLQKFEMN